MTASRSEPATATVLTNSTCNQRCGFCTQRRAAGSPTDAARARAEIDLARERGARRLILSGGEPTLSAHLAEHVRHARERGFEHVVVETNGMLLAYLGRARALADAGVSRARVALHAADEAASDRLSGVPEAFALSLRGLANAAEVGLELEVSIPITALNLDLVPAIPALLEQRAPTVRDVLVRVITEAEPRWIPRFDPAAASITALAEGARARRITVRFDGRLAIPPCFFPARQRYPELFAAGAPRDAHSRIAECESCAARERCCGVPRSYLAAHGRDGATPIPRSQARWVSRLGRDRRRVAEEALIDEAFFAQGEGGLERVIRVCYRCNQACEFCFIDRSLPSASRERIEDEIRRAAADGVALLSLSGGEPTLHPHLASFVQLAARLGLCVQLQTNGARCADPDLTRALRDAGLSGAFVSLHASRAELSELITRAPGTFARTVAGIDELAAAAVPVTLNCVVTGSNLAELPSYARFVAERWGSCVRVNFSFAHASTPRVPRDARIIPRLSDVRPPLGAAIAILRAARVPWQGFDGQCGMPLCTIDADWCDVSGLRPLPAADPPEGFVKVGACKGCSLSDRCVGARATYVAIHGAGELGPPSGR